jgi:hypothetical protein
MRSCASYKNRTFITLLKQDALDGASSARSLKDFMLCKNKKKEEEAKKTSGCFLSKPESESSSAPSGCN